MKTIFLFLHLFLFIYYFSSIIHLQKETLHHASVATQVDHNDNDKSCNKSSQTKPTTPPPSHRTQKNLSGYQGINLSEFQSSALFKPIEIPCRTGEISLSERQDLSPASNLKSTTCNFKTSPAMTPSISSTMLHEYSLPSPLKHSRNKSDCSISSLTEGSRKRHYHTISLSSDEEDGIDHKSLDRANCKQSLLSKLMESSDGKLQQPMSHSTSGGTFNPLTLPSSTVSFLERLSPGVSDFSLQALVPGGINIGHSPNAVNNACHSPDSIDSSLMDHSWSNPILHSHFLSNGQQSPSMMSKPQEMSLFEELSSHGGMGCERQNSGNSERSLFDELSGHMQDENYSDDSLEDHHSASSCLLGHPDFYSRLERLKDRSDDPKSTKHAGAESKLSDSDSVSMVLF